MTRQALTRLLLIAAAAAPALTASATDSTNHQHWAFRPLVRPPLPSIQDSAWARNPIDHFVLAELERRAIAPAAPANRTALIRRLSLDLTGLPPTDREVASFLADASPDAYERMVDRFLSTPSFGEQWGRHWLDLARYADSDGYEKDSPRPYAYLYRDWLIEAINADMPWNQFTVEQLAGDLMPESTTAQRIATGFHRQTLTNKEGGVDQEEFRCKANVDRVGTTAAVWLGLTVACAECHTHKYDPITQREFYQLYAFFNAAKETELPMPTPGELKTYEKLKNDWEQKSRNLKSEIAALEKAISALAEPAVGTDEQPAGENSSAAQKTDLGRLKRLRTDLEKLTASKPKYPATAAAILVANEKPVTTQIHVRGDFLRRGETVAPGTLRVLHPFKPRGPNADRLDLAEWLMDPANPLTPRVTVNRYWRDLFGQGLVTTVDDFGTRGELPSHPQLLDWLATEFPRLAWSPKRFIRLIVTSATYRQSADYRVDLAQRDPANRWLARQNRRRFKAETVRDVYLRASGLLNERLGGPGIRPPLPADIAALGYADSVKWKNSEGADKYRRGLYIFFQRTVPYPMLVTFDSPDGNTVCTRRETSNTPLQALTLLNDPVFFECAQALARRPAAEGVSGTKNRIQRIFELALNRRPTNSELDRLHELHRQQMEVTPLANAALISGKSLPNADVIEDAVLVTVARTVMNLDEFITRE